MTKYLAVAAGGAAGALLRYFLGTTALARAPARRAPRNSRGCASI